MPLTLKCTVAYTIASLLSTGLSFLTTPLFTRMISTEEMGVVTTYNSWVGILGTIVTLSLNSGVFSIAMMEFSDRRDEYQASSLALSCLSCLVFGGIFAIASDVWSELLGLSPDLIWLMFIYFFLTPAYSFWYSRQRYEYRYKPVLIVSCSLAVASTIASVLFVVYGKNNNYAELGKARIIGKEIPLLLVSLICFFVILKKNHYRITAKYWKFALKIGSPLIAHALAKHLLDSSDRIMIDKFCGKSEVGIYGVLYSISAVSAIVWTALNGSLVPLTFEKLKANEHKSLKEIFIPLLGVYGLICAVLMLFAPEIVKILATEEYYKAIYIMPPIAAGIFFTSLYTIFGNILMYYKKTNYIMISTIAAGIINILLNMIFIPKYGSVAASYTTLVAYCFMCVFQYLCLAKIKKPRVFNVKVLIAIIGIACAWCAVCSILYSNNIIRYAALCVILALAIVFRKKIVNAVKPYLFGEFRNKQ